MKKQEDKFEIRAIDQPMSKGIALMIIKGNKIVERLLDGHCYMPKQGSTIEPTISIDYEAAQELMDNLWRIGLRPNQKVGYEGQLEAVKYHLEDMRKIAMGWFESQKRVMIVPPQFGEIRKTEE